MNPNYKWAIIWLVISILLCAVIYYQLSIINESGKLTDEAATWPKGE